MPKFLHMQPVCEVLNSSYAEQQLPRSWKLANIVPLIKTKPVNDICKQLRPISLTLVLLFQKLRRLCCCKIHQNQIHQIHQKIGLLRKIRRYLPLLERKLFYNAVVKPVMMYGSSIWSCCSRNDPLRIFKLQKKSSSGNFRNWHFLQVNSQF